MAMRWPEELGWILASAAAILGFALLLFASGYLTAMWAWGLA